MMVGGAAKLLEYYSRGDEHIEVEFKVADDDEARHYCGMQLALSEAFGVTSLVKSLLGGAGAVPLHSKSTNTFV